MQICYVYSLFKSNKSLVIFFSHPIYNLLEFVSDYS